ncbi:MAG: protein kinase [Sandaracinus sp.]|nr:protein kinase [Sandaracinus sp.]
MTPAESTPPESTLRRGVSLGELELVELLGQGGNGEVWRAKHPSLGDVAVKTVRVVPGMEGHVAQLEARLAREAQLAARVHHPHVLSVCGHGVTPDGVHYLAMELLRGQDLAEILAHEGRLDPSLTYAVIEPLLSALEAVHRVGIVHRDLKPENLFVHAPGNDQAPVVKLIDFGIAHASSAAKLTRTGTVLGTPLYLSPEQALGEEVDERSDLYAVGVLMYEMLTGRTPFEGLGMSELLLALATRDVEPITSLRPGLPAPLAAFIHRALSRDRDARPRTAAIFRSELAIAAAASGITRGRLDALVARRRRYSALAVSSPSPVHTMPVPLVRTVPPPPVAARGARPRLGMLVAAVASLVLGAGFGALHDGSPLASASASAPPPVDAPPPMLRAPTDPAPVRLEKAAATPTEAPAPRAERPTREPSRPTAEPAPAPRRAAPSSRDEAPRRAAPSSQDEAQRLVERGRLAHVRGRSQEALRRFREATALAPDHDDAWMGRGVAAAELGLEGEARRSLRRFLANVRHSPDAARARRLLETL